MSEIIYNTRNNLWIYAGYYVAILFMAVWLVWPGLAPDEPDERSFPDVWHYYYVIYRSTNLQASTIMLWVKIKCRNNISSPLETSSTLTQMTSAPRLLIQQYSCRFIVQHSTTWRTQARSIIRQPAEFQTVISQNFSHISPSRGIRPRSNNRTRNITLAALSITKTWI